MAVYTLNRIGGTRYDQVQIMRDSGQIGTFKIGFAYDLSGTEVQRVSSYAIAVLGGTAGQVTTITTGIDAQVASIQTRLTAVERKNPISITDYGAIGDGQSHPLSNSFSTLAAAQFVYPLATSLAQEIDQVAYTHAAAAALARGGAAIIMPGGIYIADATYKLLSNCPVLGYGKGVTTIRRKTGAPIVIVANKDSIDLTGVNDVNCKIDGVTIDGNSTGTARNGEQGIGIEPYGVDGFTVSNFEVINCPYGGIDLGGRAACVDGSGQGESPAGSPPAKAPRQMSRLSFSNGSCDRNGWQEIYLEVTPRFLNSTIVGQTVVTLQAGGGANVQNNQWIGVEVQGEPNYEAIQIDTIAGDVVTFKTPLTKVHSSNVQAGGALYWADSGFGLVIRQPARYVDVFNVHCDRNYEAGIAIGQTSNIKYDPLNVRGVRITNFSSTRSSSMSVVFRLGFCDDADVSNGNIGDIGSTLISSTSTTATVQSGDGILFYGGEVVYVGNPGAGTLESATILSIAGDVITFTATLANSHSAGEQMYASMSDGLYLRQAGSGNQQGYKISNVDIRHCNNGTSGSLAQDTFLNRRHSLTNVKCWQNRGDGFRFIDVSSIGMVNCHSLDNGGWGVRQQQVFTPGLTHDLEMANVQCSGNVAGDWNLIAGTYKAVNCLGLKDTTDTFTTVPLMNGLVAGQATVDPGTAYAAIANSSAFQDQVDNTVRKYTFARVVARVSGNETGLQKGVAVYRGATFICEALWDGNVATSVVGAWVAYTETTDQSYSIRVKGSSTTEDITVFRASLQLK